MEFKLEVNLFRKLKFITNDAMMELLWILGHCVSVLAAKCILQVDSRDHFGLLW
jgi:hypothetical protein